MSRKSTMKRTTLGLLVSTMSVAPLVGAAPAPASAPVPAVVPPTSQPLPLPTVAPVIDCTALRSADVSTVVGATTKVTTAAVIDDGKSSPYCSVKVVVADYARFELHLPTRAWTQRLLFGGGPGAQTSQGLDLGQFATVSWEDLGRRQDEDVLANDYVGQVNAGYRGMHWQVLAAKSLISRFYGQGPKFSYYNACSNPGREGMIEAQRFPEDFNGIGAGCPPIATTLNNGLFHAWNVLSNTGADGRAIITADKLPILHAAVLRRCDAADGAKDGIVSNPYACTPPLAEVTCKVGQDPTTCLTPAQVAVARELYRGPHDASGARLAPSGVLPGSELAWTSTIVPSDAPFGGPKEARVATEKAIRSHYSLPALPKSWTLDQVKFDRATFAATTKWRIIHDATNPDLSPFAKAGGKLILWMNLGDTNVLPAQVILYYQAVQQRLGAKATAEFLRFYTLPGAYHCGGGDGPVIKDVLVPLMVWVERGIAPEALAGQHVPRGPGGIQQGAGHMPPSTKADLTRPIYPYPYTARYVGHGDVRDASNWTKGPAEPAPASWRDWIGQSFYRPDATQWCTPGASGLSCTPTKPAS